MDDKELNEIKKRLDVDRDLIILMGKYLDEHRDLIILMGNILASKISLNKSEKKEIENKLDEIEREKIDYIG